jgi:hypothetical protein
VSTSVAAPVVHPTTPLSANRIAQQQFDRVRAIELGCQVLPAEAWLTNTGHYWSREGVISTLGESMKRSFRHIVETSERERVTLRDAAYMIGVGRVAEASRLRGWV